MVFWPRRLNHFSSSTLRYWTNSGTTIGAIHSVSFRNRRSIRDFIVPIIQNGNFRNRGPLFRRFSTAAQVFDEMPQRDQHPQGSRFIGVLDLLKSSVSGISGTEIVHCYAIKFGEVFYLPFCTFLLTAYSKAGDFRSSKVLFEEVCYRDVIIWNAMITAALENRRYEDALCLFCRMIDEGCGFDSTTLLLIVSALSHINCLRNGKVVHSLSIKAGFLGNCGLCNALVDMYAKCSDLTSSESMFSEMIYKDVVSWNSMIKGCLHNNHPMKSLCYFKGMICFGQRADSITLSCAISASACLEEFSYGEVIHAWGLRSGHSSNISFANSLISFYSQYGLINDSELIFREMLHKDVVSWNAMIGGFASNLMPLDAFDHLYEMQLTKYIQPDTVTVANVASVCAELKLLREGRSLHGYLIRREKISDLLVINNLINMYSRCNNIANAEALFNSIPEARKDLISWNTMISGFSQNGYSEEAQSLFKELLHQNSQLSLSTLLAIIPSCDSPTSLQLGKSIHSWQLKSGFLNDILAINSLMQMYISCEDLSAAFTLFRISATKDTASWNTVIVGCTKKGHFRKAVETFVLMRQETNLSQDSITLVNVLSASGNLDLISLGKSLHALVVKTPTGSDIRVQNALITMYGRSGDIASARSVFDLCPNHNLCSWNCMISALSQNKDGRSALELFRALKYKPNEITLVSLLSACDQLGLLREGKQIHGYVFRFGYQDNSFISAALLDMYSKCGRLDTASQLFRNSHEKSIAAWNSMISAYGNHGNGKKAIQLFHEMCESGIRPSKSTFISLLSACSHSGLVDEGLRYYHLMSDKYEIEPATEHQVCMVNMLGRSGKLHEAYEFIEQIPTEPEAGVLGALLTACNYHGDIEMGRKVAERLFELAPENAGYYISMANMYVGAGRWEEAVKLRAVVEEKKLKKPPGCSLIDVGFS